MINKRSRGLTITELMVSIAIMVIGIMVFAAMQAFFSNDTKNRFIYGCLVSGASNALASCMAGQTPSSNTQCGGINVNISLSGSCQPTTSCNQISVTSSYNGFSYQESEYVCP